MKRNNLLLTCNKEHITRFMAYCCEIIDTIHFKIRTIRKILSSEKNKFQR